MRWRFTAMCDRRPPANVIHRPVSHHSRGVLLRVISHSYNQCVCVVVVIVAALLFACFYACPPWPLNRVVVIAWWVLFTPRNVACTPTTTTCRSVNMALSVGVY